MTDLLIEDADTDVKYDRSGEPNPFLAKMAALAGDWNAETGRSRKSAKATVSSGDRKRRERQIREAARAQGRGVRLSAEVKDDETVVLHFQLAVLKEGVGRKPAAKPAADKPKGK